MRYDFSEKWDNTCTQFNNRSKEFFMAGVTTKMRLTKSVFLYGTSGYILLCIVYYSK